MAETNLTLSSFRNKLIDKGIKQYFADRLVKLVKEGNVSKKITDSRKTFKLLFLLLYILGPKCTSTCILYSHDNLMCTIFYIIGKLNSYFNISSERAGQILTKLVMHDS